MAVYVKYKAREVLEAFREDIRRICVRHGALNPRITGSIVRAEDSEHSDIDLLVDFDGEYDLWRHAALWGELEELLPVRIDVLVESILKPAIRQVLVDQAQPL
ncbi:nucleotidyltransferase domain-containing protein [bacterium]|nr:nucleotidyltransferase domain-containing protein [bacterium]